MRERIGTEETRNLWLTKICPDSQQFVFENRLLGVRHIQMKKKRLLKKILSVFAVFILGSFTGIFWYKQRIFPVKMLAEVKRNFFAKNSVGRWHKINPAPGRNRLSIDQKELVDQLESLGYMDGSMPAPAGKNITVYDERLACNGLNLYISGHAPEAILMDMKGNQLYQWQCDISRIWPDYKSSGRKFSSHYSFWRRVHLMDNGDLLAIFDGIGILKLDRNSNLIWKNRNGAHHDLFVTREGLIYLLARKARIIPKYNKKKPILEDFICVLDADGNEIMRVSILEAFENSKYAPVLRRMKAWGDTMHTNTIEVLDGRLALRSPAFRQGNVLISVLWLDVVCVVDMEAQKVVWCKSGLWSRQHQPTVLDNGNMLVFDNQGLGDRSQVMELDPFTSEIKWQYSGTPDHPFYTYDCGSSARLPNGNTLITESNSGRAFEVTPDKTIVWEFLNPHRAGKHNELIATLFEVVRLRPDFPTGWMKNAGTQ